ncbi:MAG: hypothetical protein M3065_01485 [Actinomycetota bacterium]|nr:hypothetical protein [Actinomycetota bacterium]
MKAMWTKYSPFTAPNGSDTFHYQSPHAQCRKNYYDCNTGSYSRIYAHVVPEKSYIFIDYWIFYRFNDAPSPNLYFDQHQGDWEGMTIAVPARNPDGGIAYVLYRQHAGAPWSYLRGGVQCGPAKQACTPTSTRPDGFPAAGTHATYVRSCSKSFFFQCRQTNSAIPDSGRDGSRPWGNNSDPHSVIPLDQCYGPFSVACRMQSWANWNGNWNDLAFGSVAGYKFPFVASPAGANRGQDYNDPAHFYHKPPQCENGPSTCPKGAHTATARRANLTAPTATAADPIPAPCQTWLGPDVTALACDAKAISSDSNPSLDNPGSLQLSSPEQAAASGVGSTDGSAPGLAQLTGAPLAPNEHVTVTGTGSASEELFVVTQGLDETVRGIVFANPQLDKGAATIQVSAIGDATLQRPGQPDIPGVAAPTAQPTDPFGTLG